MAKVIEIRVLGELEVVRQGTQLRLPPSRKTRALMAYLLLTGKPHLRQRLCDIFWQGPDDPRGALRWSLSQIRKLVDEDGTRRLVADRERVTLTKNGLSLDLNAVRRVVAAGVETVPLGELWAALNRFRGELLEGLELSDCYQFHGWCTAQREAARSDRLTIIRALLARLDDPKEQLTVACQWASVDPLTQHSHGAVIRALLALGRREDAHAQYHTCRKLLTEAFGVEPSEALHQLKIELETAAPLPIATEAVAPAATAPAPLPPEKFIVPFIGRQAEVNQIDTLAEAARQGQSSPVLLLSGEPGIGKSRLMAELGTRMMPDGMVLRGKAFEAEMARPFGPWVEAFNTIPAKLIPAHLTPDLAPLLPNQPLRPHQELDQNRLFGAVSQLLAHLATTRPVALLLDDLHWFDTVSLSLLHFIARGMDHHGRLVIACSVRPGELIDNPNARRVLRSLGKERCIRELRLSPLDHQETVNMVAQVAAGVDADRVFEVSGGNPFVAMEVAAALGRGETDLPDRVEHLVMDRLTHVGVPAQTILPWAAAMGASFDPEVLERATGQAGGPLLEALTELEARGVLTVTESGDYDFSHDLLRRAVYRDISSPRKRMLHRQIARALNGLSTKNPYLASDVVHHAELGADHELLAQSCVLAAEQSLRLFAIREAMGFANQGLQQVDRLPQATRMAGLMTLLRVLTLATSSAGIPHLDSTEKRLNQTVLQAEQAGAQQVAASGHYLLSIIHEDRGDSRQASTDSLRAADRGRNADLATTARQLANTARCLLQLEQDVGRARELLGEAEGLCRQAGLAEVELTWGIGLLAHWDGDEPKAVQQLGLALKQARAEQDLWRECNCLSWLASIAYEHGHGDEVRRHCAQLQTLAAKMGEGAKGTHAQAFMALQDRADNIQGAEAQLGRMFDTLRAEDNKALLAYTLNAAAGQSISQGQPRQACQFAEEALKIATAIRRPSEVALAHMTLATVYRAAGDDDNAAMHQRAVQKAVAGVDAVSKRVGLALAERIDDDKT